MEELLKQMEAQAKKDLAIMLKNQIGLSFDAAVAMAGEKVKEAIPGQVDDAVIALVVPAIAPVLKEALLAQIAKLEA